MISLAWTLVCALVFEPALLGPVETAPLAGQLGNGQDQPPGRHPPPRSDYNFARRLKTMRRKQNLAEGSVSAVGERGNPRPTAGLAARPASPASP